MITKFWYYICSNWCSSKSKSASWSVGIESCRSLQGTSMGAMYRDMQWSSGCIVSQRLGNGMLHHQGRLHGSSILWVQYRRWGDSSCIMVRQPLSRRHWEVVQGCNTVGDGGGMQSVLLGCERQRIEWFDKIVYPFLFHFVVPACHDSLIGCNIIMAVLYWARTTWKNTMRPSHCQLLLHEALSFNTTRSTDSLQYLYSPLWPEWYPWARQGYSVGHRRVWVMHLVLSRPHF